MTGSLKRSHHLRKGRFSEQGRCYLLTTCTRNRQPIFNDFYAARTVVQAMRYQDYSARTQTLAYVVMPDHIHWLCQLNGESLSFVMAKLKSWVTKSLGQQVWQRNYHDRAFRNGEDLVSVSRYIVANPLRAGLVEHIGDYPHWDAVWLTGAI